jgi:integrase
MQRFAMSRRTGRIPKGFVAQLDRIFSARGSERAAVGKRTCSYKTQYERKRIVRQVFETLYALGYRLASPQALATRHVEVLTRHWDQGGLCAGTLRTRISALRMFAVWIGKPGLVALPAAYFAPERIARRTVATRNLAWEAHGVAPGAVIERAFACDERLALYLALQHVFGMRTKESIEFRPRQALQSDGASFVIYEGTKGGRPRVVSIETAAQRAVFDWALSAAALARGGRLRWDGYTWETARTRYYYLVREVLGVSKAVLGVTSHGLRHGFAQRRYRGLAGAPSPIEGGRPDGVDHEVHRIACQAVSRDLGHSRPNVTGAYYGSYGHAMRGVVRASEAASRAQAALALSVLDSRGQVGPSGATHPTYRSALRADYRADGVDLGRLSS